MDKQSIRVLDLKDSSRFSGESDYWQEQSIEARLSAVEELRLQFGKLPPGRGYDGSQRLRRVLRVVPLAKIRASGRKQDLLDLESLT